MRFFRILAFCGALAAAVALPAAVAPDAYAQTGATARARVADDVILEMADAYRRRDRARLSALLPQAIGHPLEPWAAYWELRARLDDATADEVDAFLARYRGTYQEDRLRNDWMLVSGKRRDWASFTAVYPQFRMRDDPEVRCYLVAAELAGGAVPDAPQVERVRSDWNGERSAGDGCQLAAAGLLQRGLFTPADVWKRARLALDAGNPAAVRPAVELVAPEAGGDVAALQKDPVSYLSQRAHSASAEDQELAALALIQLARQSADLAANQMAGSWAARLAPATRDWVWGVIGKWSALERTGRALDYYGQVQNPGALDDELLAWAARAALRAADWPAVERAITAMSADGQGESAWVYWKARAQHALARTDAERQAARAGFELLVARADQRDFYRKLALEALGRPVTVPRPPDPLTSAERAAARNHPGLRRALLAIQLGLRSEGVREWNYWTNLHDPAGMDDRALYAAADLACAHQVWDRCINTSERTHWFVDLAQRFPMPLHDRVVQQARTAGLDPAYVYGLIRQESRFITRARSGVGASGLMQIIPATARWTARHIGLEGFVPSMINAPDINLLIGTSYLKLALDDFQESMPLAASAYNAGPGRPRVWRDGPVLEGAVWVENIPYNETRDYVKKVLSNTVEYGALLRGKAPSLTALLGSVGPLPPDAPDPSQGLP